MLESEADTCRRYITPSLVEAGWDIHSQIAEQRPVTDGRIDVVGSTARRRPPKRLDYLLRYTRDTPLAVVEAKAFDIAAASGLQQAVDYATKLGVPFAFAANGRDIIERDLVAGTERSIDTFPGPDELWYRYKVLNRIPETSEELLLSPYYHDSSRSPRYYQYLSINRTIEEIAKGKDRILLTLATGTGKSFIAFQICYRLWHARWNKRASQHRPRMLYLADRNILVDQPRIGVFAPFGEAMCKIGGGATGGREMYFATYQQIARDERRPGLYREYEPEFFDLVIVDECHRGSASDESNWREILEYFTPATQVGMTATPLRDENRDTYNYFGAPVVQYSLADGIEDGFLAPYKVRRVVPNVDATGWRPTRGQRDRFNEEIPDRLYNTRDFDRSLIIEERTVAVAKHLAAYLQKSDPYAKTIVFCVDQDHASRMRSALIQFSRENVAVDPNYVVRITSDEGEFGRGHLDSFQDVDSSSPVIVTTSDMLTTGVDIPTVKNIVIARWLTSMPTFKQMIGRGTRLRTDYNKWYFTILDYTGAATRLFADSAFDGEPIVESEQNLDDAPTENDEQTDANRPEGDQGAKESASDDPYRDLIDREGVESKSKKLYVDGVPVEISAEVVYHLSPTGQRLSAVSYTEYVGEQVRTLFNDCDAVRERWLDPAYRQDLVGELESRGIQLEQLLASASQPDADAFDILCNLAFNTQVQSRRERAGRAKEDTQFWTRYSEAAKEVLTLLLTRYEEVGISELALPAAVQVPPLSELGNVVEIADRFGGAMQLREAIFDLQRQLYAA